jgi:hypothetical protein
VPAQAPAEEAAQVVLAQLAVPALVPAEEAAQVEVIVALEAHEIFVAAHAVQVLSQMILTPAVMLIVTVFFAEKIVIRPLIQVLQMRSLLIQMLSLLIQVPQNLVRLEQEPVEAVVVEARLRLLNQYLEISGARYLDSMGTHTSIKTKMKSKLHLLK